MPAPRSVSNRVSDAELRCGAAVSESYQTEGEVAHPSVRTVPTVRHTASTTQDANVGDAAGQDRRVGVGWLWIGRRIEAGATLRQLPRRSDERTVNRELASRAMEGGSWPPGYHSSVANKMHSPGVTAPPPSIPWQITGNHWIALPWLNPADASIHAVVARRGARSAIEFAGGPGFLDGGEPPLARPTLVLDGVRHQLSEVPIAWERAIGWIPTFTCTIGECLVRGTIFAPYGRDADVSGAVYALSIENRGGAERSIDVVLGGTAGHRQLRVRTRPFDDPVRVGRAPSGAVLLRRFAARARHAGDSADGRPRSR
jgi:hypothetical protein